jgi:O-antigen/teichoic acid export membrane protein
VTPPNPEPPPARPAGAITTARQFVQRITGSRIARSGFWSLGIRIAFAGLTFLASALLARMLGAAGFGIYSYALALATLLSVPSRFGLSTLLVRETARGVARQDYGLVRGGWVWAGRITVLSSVVIAVLAATAMFVWRASLSAERLATFAWAVLLIPLVALGNLRGAALRGLQHVVEGLLPEFVLRPAFLVMALAIPALVISRSLSPAGAMGAHVAAAALAFAIGASLLWRATPDGVRHAKPRFETRAWLRSILPLALIQQMQVINRQAAVLLLGVLMADADVGVYRVAAQVSLLTAFGLQAATNVVAPRFARFYAQGNTQRLQRLAVQSARGILAFNLIATTGLVLAGRLFLAIVFGREYVSAYVPMVVLLGGQVVNSAVGSVGALLNMTGHERETAKGVTVSVVCNLVLNVTLIPRFGIVGSAIATAVSLAIWNALLWLAVRRHLGINSLAFARV